MEEVVVKIVNVFVDALPHVPEHRRLPVLVQLVDTLGAERFLWVLLVLLFEQYVTKTVLLAACGEKVRGHSGVRRRTFVSVQRGAAGAHVADLTFLARNEV